MTPDQERWAEALFVLKTHGDRAETLIAERIRTLAEKPAGSARWHLIGDRLRQVRDAQAQGAEQPN